MAYDEELDARVAAIVEPWGAERKRMFGGTGYLLRGNMLAGVHKGWLVVRLGPEAGDEALSRPGVRPFDISGRPMSGWLMVDPAAAEGEELLRWLTVAREFVETLPPKD